MILLCLVALASRAQRHEVFDDRIATVQVVANEDWQRLPIIKLGTADRVNISFDDLTHTYHRYTYSIVHCNSDWTEDEDLFDSDYIYGFKDGNVIGNLQESMNTNTLYMHYKFHLPSESCRIKMSGNYRVTVYDEDDGDKKMFSACFMVVDPKMSVSMDVRTNTDTGVNSSYQQVFMTVNFQKQKVTNPKTQISTYVLQNQRWDTAKMNMPFQTEPNSISWGHFKGLIFYGGNEYHKYEFLDLSHPTMGIDRIVWDGERHHVYPFAAEPRRNYVYDEDANGAFYIRNSDNEENDYATDYALVHYELKAQEVPNAKVYINGVWTYNRFTERNLMTYNREKHCYEAQIWQKQGYYSYNFVVKDQSGNSHIFPQDGNFYQTENRYTALVYWRPDGARTDYLVGLGDMSYK